MSQGVVMDITAQITGYQSSLNTLKTEIDKINIGSPIGKKLKTAFEQATKQVQDLNRAANTRATNDNQIDALFDKANRAGEAILKIVELLQSVKTSDLDFSKFGGDFGKIQKEIENLSDALNAKILVGLRETIASSDELSKVFKDIVGIDVSKATTAELFDALNKKSQEASANMAETQKEIDNLNNKIEEQTSIKSKLESGPLGSIISRDALQAQAKELESAYNDIFSELRQKMSEGLAAMSTGDLDKEQLLNSFFQGLTPENIKQKIIELYSSFADAGLYQNQKRQFYNDLFGFGNDINDVVKKINLGDPQPIIDKFTELINSVASQIGGKNASNIKELINKGDIEAAAEKTIKDFEAAYGKIQNAIQRSVDKTKELTEQKQSATEIKASESQISEIVKAATAELEKKITEIETENKQLRTELEALKTKNEATKTTATQKIKDEALKSGGSAQELRLSTEEANKYKTALQQVQEREQLVGKIQGIVQRWFSIYAAVRMVSNAIKSVISTVKELDKTITEIAIVTNMTQDDLWKQMSNYTDMARQYASSISGVYQVSQLYYQQGKLSI